MSSFCIDPNLQIWYNLVMKYKIEDWGISATDKADFSPKQTLECGQMFRFAKTEDGRYVVYSKNHKATIAETADGYAIYTANPQYFVDYFDLSTNYSQIKMLLNKHKCLREAISIGGGIRLAKQDPFETAVEFIISQNNNIKRIKLILSKLCERFGTNMGDYFAFPTREQFAQISKEEFAKLGAGYRADYLFKFGKQIEKFDSLDYKNMTPAELKPKLIEFAGIGPKVADCIMLFGMNKREVFPVDVWMHRLSVELLGETLTPEKASQKLVEKFGALSGYAQQYLYYYKAIQKK